MPFGKFKLYYVYTLTHCWYTLKKGAHISSFVSPFKNLPENHFRKQLSYCSLSSLQFSPILFIEILKTEIIVKKQRLYAILTINNKIPNIMQLTLNLPRNPDSKNPQKESYLNPLVSIACRIINSKGHQYYFQNEKSGNLHPILSVRYLLPFRWPHAIQYSERNFTARLRQPSK